MLFYYSVGVIRVGNMVCDLYFRNGKVGMKLIELLQKEVNENKINKTSGDEWACFYVCAKILPYSIIDQSEMCAKFIGIIETIK